jgi:single-stranded DNA-binding protein
MAIELERFLSDQLDHLPPQHPDRRFLEGLQEALAGYIEQTGSLPPATTDRAPAETPPDDPALPEQASPSAAVATDVTMLYDAGASAEPGAPTELAQAEQEERQRVVLRGRLGQRVRFSTTKNGVRRAEFNLAEAADEAHTTWHTVLAFRHVAERLEQAAPRKGQYAEVIGYRHTEERTTKDGQPKTVERVIAAHIRLR